MKPLRPGAEPTLELIVRHIEVGQIGEIAEFLGQLACPKKCNVSKMRRSRSDRMLSGPVRWLSDTSRTVKLARSPSSLGRQPTENWRLSAQNYPLRPGAEPTFKLIIRHIEVGQMDKFAEFLGQFACQKKCNVSDCEAAQTGC